MENFNESKQSNQEKNEGDITSEDLEGVTLDDLENMYEACDEALVMMMGEMREEPWADDEILTVQDGDSSALGQIDKKFFPLLNQVVAQCWKNKSLSIVDMLADEFRK